MSALGIDIGGTTTVAVVLERGRVLASRHVPTRRGEGVVASAVVAAREALAAADTRVEQLEGVGLGVPGFVGDDRTLVRGAVNIGIETLDIGAAVGAGLGVPVTVDNDVRVAVLGARHLMAEPTGAIAFAAGVAYDERVLRGASGMAGEIGHIPVPGTSERCRCGQHGCLETIASGWSLAERWDDPIPPAAMLAAADAGDERGMREWGAFVDAIAHAVRGLVLTTGVDVVLIGGGVSGLGAPLLDGVRSRIAAWAEESPLLTALDLSARIRLLPPGAQPGAVGAAILGSGQWRS